MIFHSMSMYQKQQQYYCLHMQLEQLVGDWVVMRDKVMDKKVVMVVNKAVVEKAVAEKAVVKDFDIYRSCFGRILLYIQHM